MARIARWQHVAERDGRWREDDARLAVAAWRASGKTLSSFSSEHGLGKRLERWERKLCDRDRDRATEEPVALPALIPVHVHGSSSSVVIVLTDDSLRVEVADPSRAPARWVGELVLALRGVAR